MSQHASIFLPSASPMPTMAYATPARQTRAALRRNRVGDRYFAVLCLCLLGYALAGRGFAYWGVSPLYVGEVMLLVGVAVLIRLRVLKTLMNIHWFIPLMLFMIMGAARTIPFLDVYGAMSIRDAVFWGYGTFAFIVAGLMIQNPMRVQKLVLYGRRYVYWFLALAPPITIICSFFEAMIPMVPGSDSVPILQVKGGDLCVHLAGCYAYVVALGKGISPWFYATLIPLNFGLNLQGRAAIVAFAVAAGVAIALRGFHPRQTRIWFVMLLGLFALWASDIHIEKASRELSFKQLVKGVGSIFGNADDETLDGSKEWRQKWWSDIYHYTVKGKYFWTGKGFGVNLASDDGYMVDAEESLRSPHNGHMTVLARMGVPGILLWAAVQFGWATMVAQAYFRARRLKHTNWSGVFMFLGTYWAAFMANAAFDVFLEGPMGGIWMWCLYGAGVGSVWVYRRHPNLLTSTQPQPGFASAPMQWQGR